MIGVSYVGGAHGDELKKPPGSTRLCKVCHEQYNEENNPPGSCRLVMRYTRGREPFLPAIDFVAPDFLRDHL